ncbi:MAG: RES family NAD+ phosphorylase [Candidatus Eremiobacteraeota bacterium]|nr:RES family NAD+ phosphorylase [Candidatus Eremiobacteraeota bacterium]
MGGRWNFPGRPMVYCSLNLSLAALEVLVHLHEEDLPVDYVAQIFVADGSKKESITTTELPSDWQNPRRSAHLQEIGDKWLAEERCAIVTVPSVIIPEESNVLVNPRHRDFSKVTVRIARPFRFDFRLLG